MSPPRVVAARNGAVPNEVERPGPALDKVGAARGVSVSEPLSRVATKMPPAATRSSTTTARIAIRRRLRRRLRSSVPEYDRIAPLDYPQCGLFTLGRNFVESLLQRVPRERRALDAHGELHDTLQRFQIAELDAFELGAQVFAVAFTFELRFVDRHQ